ncbi:hypothetical protein [Bradyrhizobium sp. CSS354]|uniref:hypothetical protein n=1 Tax=Bradyrhizobium sp. CSS354 TaxID=2699172 RepID=UPI0023AEDE72|nr:hypothetical protein [Bradyrhizobium sp. CSS354]MDE5463345.1 hypothetical protein [Bradyrhizobium sp. CSS354]
MINQGFGRRYWPRSAAFTALERLNCSTQPVMITLDQNLLDKRAVSISIWLVRPGLSMAALISSFTLQIVLDLLPF